MLSIAGRTTGPILMKFFVDTHGLPGGVKGLKNLKIFFQNFFTGNALQLVLLKCPFLFFAFYRN